MEDIDDDFGELYADLEVQASLHKLDSTGDDASDKVSSPDANGDKDVIVDTGSDSEDDLNILLNDDGDSPAFPVTCGVNLRGGGYEDEEEENGGSLMEGSGSDKNRKCIDQSQVGDGLEQSLSCVGGGDRGNGGKCGYHSQYKYIRSHPEAFASNSKGNGCLGIGSYSSVSGRGEQVDNGCNQHMRSSSLVAQRKHNFSLPRSRTILDVNIDTFGHKPWRLPEADITDYFNFGFDEDRWKHYCNKLDQYRHGEYMSPKILASESRKTNEACEAGLEDGRMVPSTIPCEQKGRAIQVEDSILERQPSMNVRRPLYRDLDVIQITLQDSKGDSSGSLKGISALIDCSELEISENGDSEHDDRENRDFYNASEDELQRDYLDYLDGHDKGVDKLVAQRRLAQQPKASKAVSTNSDNYKRAYVSDDGHHHQEVEFNASNGTVEAIEISNYTKEKVERMLGAKSAQGERSQHSPSSSSSGHCEAPRYGCYTEKSRNHIKRPSPNSAKLWDSVASDYYHSTESRKHGAKTREVDCKYYDKQRRRIQVDTKHCNRRISGGSVPKVHFEEEKVLPSSDTERHYDKNRRRHGFDSNNRKDISYYNESERSFNYHGKSPRRNEHESFGVENDKYLRRNFDEEEYFIEERMSRMNDELMARDWYRYERGLDVEDMDPIVCKERSSYLNHEIGVQRKRKAGNLQFRRRIKNDEFSLEDQFPNDFARERYEKSVPYDNLAPEYLEDEYDECLPYNTRIPGRIDGRNRSPSIFFNDLRSMDEDDEFWRFRDRRSFSSHSCAEPHRANLNSPRDDLYERTKYKREIWTERSGESGWCGGYSDSFDTEESIDNRDNNVVRFGRRHYWKSEVLHWTEDESISRHRDDTFSRAEIASFSFQTNSRPKMFDAKHGEDGKVEWHWSKLINQGNRGNRFGRNSNIMCRGNREQILRRCENSVDSQVVVRERKSFGRFNARGGIYNNARPESITWNINAEKKTSDKSKERDTDKVPQADIPKLEEPSNKNEKLLVKFPVRKNKALDIEEGQIIAEEINKSIENIRPSNNVAEASFLKESLNKNATDGNTGIQVKKNNRILEVIAKMEKRRERFKEPICLKEPDPNPDPDPEITPKPLADPVGERLDMKQQRPARKRRWGGN